MHSLIYPKFNYFSFFVRRCVSYEAFKTNALTGIQLWSVITDHFRSRAHVIIYRISKNRSQNAFSTAMESSASSLSWGFLTLAQGSSSKGFLRPFRKGRLRKYFLFLIFVQKLDNHRSRRSLTRSIPVG